MTPYYSDQWLDVYQGDCRAVMAELPAESVHCVVTSPPYWGLRDYGISDQLGLEATPEEYVANLVAVFREVRRVLRNDGTVWLNLGSSYASTGGERTYGSYDGATGRGPGTRRNRASGGTSPSPSPQPASAPAYGSDGTALQGSTVLGSAYSGLCDGCRAVLSPRTPDTLLPLPDDASPLSLTDRDTAPPGSERASADASPPDVQASTTPRSEPQPQGPCSHCGACGACLEVLRSSSRDARACVRRSWLNYPTFKQKDLVPIPWLVALALQADGWYLRRDVIWNKPNPMPESVTDRPTSSHEYLLLLSKSPRYYYDADAVREASLDTGGNGSFFGRQGGSERYGEALADMGSPGTTERHPYAAGRNLRSVWTIATQPYPGAHFATFPRKLVEPCVKAGCPELGTVLDPFAGSGTTGVVAQSLNRRAILIDLNGDYLVQAMQRNRDIPLGLGAA